MENSLYYTCLRLIPLVVDLFLNINKNEPNNKEQYAKKCENKII